MESVPPEIEGRASADVEQIHAGPRFGYVWRHPLTFTRERGSWLVRRILVWLGWTLRNSPRLTGHTLTQFLRGLIRLVGLVWRWADQYERRDAIRRLQTDSKVSELRRVSQDSNRNVLILLSLLVLVLIGQVVAYYRYGWTPLITQVVLLVALCEIVGYRPGEHAAPELSRKMGPLRHGIPISQLRAEILAILLYYKVTAQLTSFVIDEYGWNGVLHSEVQDIGDTLVSALERGLHAPPGSISAIKSGADSSSYRFRIRLIDPLDETPDCPPIERGNVSIYDLLPLGMHRDSKLFGMRLLRTHLALIGKSRSGKTRALWVIIRMLLACREVEIDAIDLSNGPAFPAWRGCIRRFGRNTDEAHVILDDAITLIQNRTAELTRLVEQDELDDNLEDNHQPSPEHPQRIIAIDEFPLLSDDKELMVKIKTILRTGAKAAVTAIVCAQGSGKEDLGSTVARSQINAKVIMACEIADVTRLLGGGMADQGWRPHHLQVAVGDQPNDAGKGYVRDGDHDDPDPIRFFGLDMAQVRQLARDLIASGLPWLSIEPTASDPVLPVAPDPILLSLREIFLVQGVDRLPTSELVHQVGDIDAPWRPAEVNPDTLGALLRPLGVTPTRFRTKAGPVRGYKLEDIQQALGEQP